MLYAGITVWEWLNALFSTWGNGQNSGEYADK